MFSSFLVFCSLHLLLINARPVPNEDGVTSEKDPWLNGDRFQGDIDGYDKQSFDALIKRLNDWQDRRHSNKSGGSAQSAISDPRGLWLNGVVPYYINSGDEQLRNAVAEAIAEYESTTCIRFVERTNEENYVNILDYNDGCHSWMGNIHHGPQTLNLGPGCRTKGIALHELMHALGFWHEQQRTDRDDYIIVLTENIQPSQLSQYAKAETSRMNLIGNYDMDSVMHYSSHAFALPGRLTMKAINSDRTNFGGKELTEEDKRKIRMLYGCSDVTGDTSIQEGVTYFIKAEGTNNCLDVPGGSGDNGINLQQWDCNGTPAQQWVFTRLGDNAYAIKNVGSGKYVDVAAEELDEEGGKVQQYEEHEGGPSGTKEQQFKLEQRDGGLFHLTSVANGKIIWPDSEGQVHHWKYDAGQNWKLERM